MTIAESAPQLTRDVYEQFINISNDTKRRAGLSAIAELFVKSGGMDEAMHSKFDMQIDMSTNVKVLRSRSRDFFKFQEINDNTSETVQDRDTHRCNRKSNRKSLWLIE